MPNALNTEEFISKAIAKHGDKYDYSEAEYQHSKIKIKIICPIHGLFNQLPASHLFGQGCPKCKKSFTNEKFIEKAIAVHGNKYNYSEIAYKNSQQKIKIICPIHGVFFQTANLHLQGGGCPKCAGNIKSTTEDFIEKAIARHGDKYDYSQVKYKNKRTKVKIICRIHGEFEQDVKSHLKQGSGCPKCNRRISDTETFIEKANKKHDYKYDYSKTEYKRNNQKITIICPIHGEFEQTARLHLQSCGCPKCVYLNQGLGTEKFIEKAKSVHGEKYDYSGVNYKNRQTEVKILCPIHGFFNQKPVNHLDGHGCLKCGNNVKSTTEDFITKAIAVHKDKYDYSEVEYKGSKQKVKIICPSHGLFEQTATKHLQSCGCPSCGVVGFKHNMQGLLYFLKFDKPFATFWKIGVTNKSIKERFHGECKFITFQYEWNFDIGSDAYKIEQSVLKKFKKYQFEGFSLFNLLDSGGDTECFNPNLPSWEVLSFIESQLRNNITKLK